MTDMTEKISQPALLLINGCDSTTRPSAAARRGLPSAGSAGPAAVPVLRRQYCSIWPEMCDGLSHLYTAGTFSRDDFSLFMEEIWHFVTPGRMGVMKLHTRRRCCSLCGRTWHNFTV